MTKVRVLVFLITIIVVGGAGLVASYYARGYRFDPKTLKFQPNGIMVIQSEPTGASVYVDGELKTATNATFSLSPGTYDVEIKKDGYFTWYKRLTIEKEVVTQANVSLFKNVPSLSPVTFFGAINPVSSEDETKIAFSVLPDKNTSSDSDKIGLWTMDTFTLPLGFTNEPKRIADGDMTNATYTFSPDNRQILLTTATGVFLLDAGSFTPQASRTNISQQKSSILSRWAKEKESKNESLIHNLPQTLSDILDRKASNIAFAPDGNMVLYTASDSGTLPNDLIPPLPGASTQNQERDIKMGHTYVYDIKEDRNFLVSDQPVTIGAQEASGSSQINPALRWMPSSRHLLLAQNGQVVIMDYDGTNRQVIYSGSYEAPFAFPYSNATKLLILTNLGAGNATPNLYTLTVK